MNITLHHIQGLLRSMRFWTAITFAVLVSASVAVDYRQFCQNGALSANITEPFLIGSGYRLSCVFHPINACFMISNAPFYDGNAIFTIYRSGRKKWYWQSVIYIVILIFLYYAVDIASSMFAIVPVGSFSNTWGQGIRMLTDESGTYMLSNGVAYESSVLEHYAPLGACVTQYLLLSFYTSWLAVIYYVLSYCGRKSLAFATVILIHAILFLAYLDGIYASYSLFTWVNLQKWASAEGMQKVLFGSAILLSCAVSLLYGSRKAKNTDIGASYSMWS